MNKLNHSDVNHQPSPVDRSPDHRNKTVMIVEDDEELVRLYEKILKMRNFRVTATAKNGIEAINQYKKIGEKPSVIIIDHRMPFKDGLETLIELRRIGYKDKVIYISGEYKSKKDAMKKGANSFLEKPFSIKDLMAQI
ncbi:MAG: response regulator [Promethearchaeia archaeon]